MVEWFTGRDEISSLSYDFVAKRPVWETGWFLIFATTAVVCIAGFFWIRIK
jgi:hypothetical protein